MSRVRYRRRESACIECHDHFIRTRPLLRHHWHAARQGAAQHARSGTACRAVGLHALLAGRAPPALQVYRERFQPSEQLERPYAMVGVNVIAAETDGAARRLFTSAQQQFTNLLRGTRGQLPAPIDDIDRYWSPAEAEQVSKMLACSFVGSPEVVREGLGRFVERSGADEVIVAAAIHDHGARLRSYELLAGTEVGEQPSGAVTFGEGVGCLGVLGAAHLARVLAAASSDGDVQALHRRSSSRRCATSLGSISIRPIRRS